MFELKLEIRLLFSTCIILVRRGSWALLYVRSVCLLVCICAGLSGLVYCLEAGIIVLAASFVVLPGFCEDYWMQVLYKEQHNNTTKSAEVHVEK